MGERTLKRRADFPKGNAGLADFYAYLGGHYAQAAKRMRELPIRRAEALEAKAKELRESVGEK